MSKKPDLHVWEVTMKTLQIEKMSLESPVSESLFLAVSASGRTVWCWFEALSALQPVQQKANAHVYGTIWLNSSFNFVA